MSASDESAHRKPRSETTGRGLTITVLGCPDGLPAELRRAARRTLRAEGYRCGELEIAVVGDAEMRRQHARWLGDDATTDVLSFDLRAKPRAGRVDGQLLVCKSVARRRARSRKTDWRGELLLYVVHGCLHLSGYDDGGAASAARMHHREDEILTALGWGPVFSGRRRKRRNAETSERRAGWRAAKRQASVKDGV